MKKIFSGIAALALGAAMVGSLAGCGGGSPNNYSKYDKDGRLILTIWATDQYANSEVKAKFQGYLDKFNDTEEMKELGVKLNFLPMSLLPSTLNTACLTGPQKMPDIVIWDRFSTPSYTKILLPLDDLIEKDGIDKTEFLSEAYNELSVNGAQYGLPLDADPWGIYINMDAVNAYNEDKAEGEQIDVENLNTWSALMSAGEKLTVRNGNSIKRSGLNTTSADGQFFSFVYTGTGELIDTREGATYGDTVMKEGTALFQDAQSLRVYDSLAFFKELYKKNLCDTGHGGTDAFGNGLCTMTYGSIYFPQELSKYALKNYKMLPYPARDLTYVGDEDAPGAKIDPSATDSLGMKNGTVGGMLGGYGLAIPQPANKAMHTKDWKMHVEKSLEVIKLWLMNDEMNELYFTENQSITCRTDFWTTNKFYTENTGVIGDILPYLQNYKMRPSVAGYELFESSVVRSQIQAMKEGNTVYKTYGNIRNSGNEVLRQAQGRG